MLSESSWTYESQNKRYYLDIDDYRIRVSFKETEDRKIYHLEKYHRHAPAPTAEGITLELDERNKIRKVGHSINSTPKRLREIFPLLNEFKGLPQKEAEVFKSALEQIADMRE